MWFKMPGGYFVGPWNDAAVAGQGPSRAVRGAV
jgi:hypothetical protein